jgi:mycothiol system anti-sigma-R factor
MADCNETIRELYAYLDNELGTDTRQAVTRHLDGCLDCLSAFDFSAELRTVIARKARETHVPDSLLERIKACFGLDDDDLGGSSPGANGQ